MPRLPLDDDLAHMLDDDAVSSDLTYQDKNGDVLTLRCILRSAEGLYGMGVSEFTDAKTYALMRAIDVARIPQNARVTIECTEYSILAILGSRFGYTRVLLGTDQSNAEGDYNGWS